MRAGVRTPEQMRDAMAATSGSDLRATLATVEECQAALARLTAALDERAGYDSPSTSSLRDILQNIAAAIRHSGGEKAVSPSGPTGSSCIRRFWPPPPRRGWTRPGGSTKP